MMKKMNFDNLTERLKEHGIEAEHIEVMKNGVHCMGLRVLTEGSVSPVVYYSQQETLEDLISRINDVMRDMPTFDVGVLNDREYVLEHLLISVQKQSTDEDDLVKRKILNIEGILRLDIGCSSSSEYGSIKVTKQILEMVGVTEDEAWESAMRNMVTSFTIRSLSETLGFMVDDTDPFSVCTTDNGMNGAASLAFPEVFEVYCRRHNKKACILLPSSTQEILILDDGVEGFSYRDLANMVFEVNAAEVDPIIQLDPVVYRYSMDTKSIEIVAEV